MKDEKQTKMTKIDRNRTKINEVKQNKELSKTEQEGPITVTNYRKQTNLTTFGHIKPKDSTGIKKKLNQTV